MAGRGGQWLADHDDGVMSCSALKRRYRRPVTFAQNGYRVSASDRLAGADRCQAGRQIGPLHAVVLLVSQFDALEPLDPDEHGMAIDVGQSVDTIVEAFVKFLSVSP